MSNTKRALQALNDNFWQPIVNQDKKRHKHVATKLFMQPFELATGQSQLDNEVDILPRNKTSPSKASNYSGDDSIPNKVSNLSDKIETVLTKITSFEYKGMVDDSDNDATDKVVESEDLEDEF